MPHDLASPPCPAPLDPFIVDFLDWLRRRPAGYVPALDAQSVAVDLDWPLPFVEVVFTSAKMRRLLEVDQPYGRGRVHWSISPAGEAWRSSQTAVPTDGAAAPAF